MTARARVRSTNAANRTRRPAGTGETASASAPLRTETAGSTPIGRVGRVGRQRGSVPILAFIFLIVVLILAFAIDAGYAFMKRRDLQRTADMAALAGAQTLPGCANATSYDTVARNNVTANLGSNVTGLTIATSCGIWTSPAATATTPGTFVAATAANASSGNAVSVTLTLGVPSFFQLTGTRTIAATAVARKAPAVVTFTVDSGLLALNTNNSLLAPLLQAIGITPSLYVAAGQQLVGVNVTPKGLLQALGVQCGAVGEDHHVGRSVESHEHRACRSERCPFSIRLGDEQSYQRGRGK